MTTSVPTVLITGATGQVGGATIACLQQHTGTRVVAGARSPEKARKQLGPDTEVVHLDLDRPETLAAAFRGVDRALLVTGYTVDMLKQSKMFLDAAREAGVRHIVHLGACGRDDTHVGHWAWHQFVERYIEWAGFTFTHLRPEWFMQNLVGYGGSRPVQQGVLRQYVEDAAVSWVDCEDVAAVAAEALRDPETHAGRTYRLGYDAKTFDEIAAVLAEELGQEFRYDPRPPEEFLTRMREAGAEMAYMSCVYQHYKDYAAGTIPGAAEVFDNFNRITGRQPVTWRDFIRRHAESFRY
jgi:uncharacterized protein YbjT (DUF2867 family)